MKEYMKHSMLERKLEIISDNGQINQLLLNVEYTWML